MKGFKNILWLAVRFPKRLRGYADGYDYMSLRVEGLDKNYYQIKGPKTGLGGVDVDYYPEELVEIWFSSVLLRQRGKKTWFGLKRGDIVYWVIVK